MEKEKAIGFIKDQINTIHELQKKQRFSLEFKKWHRDTQVVIVKIFGDNSNQLRDFNSVNYSFQVRAIKIGGDPAAAPGDLKRFYDGLDEAQKILESFIDEIEKFGISSNGIKDIEANILEKIIRLCDRFHNVVRRLRSRYNNRPTLPIDDEYDVQDLLHALLIIFFNDIRKEEWTPSYAGSASKIDFLLKKEQIAIEIKKTRKGLGEKEIGEELIIDIKKYKSHPDCKTLICFVYDPENKISNPYGLENDLKGKHDNLNVIGIVRPL